MGHLLSTDTNLVTLSEDTPRPDGSVQLDLLVVNFSALKRARLIKGACGQAQGCFEEDQVNLLFLQMDHPTINGTFHSMEHHVLLPSTPYQSRRGIYCTPLWRRWPILLTTSAVNFVCNLCTTFSAPMTGRSTLTVSYILKSGK